MAERERYLKELERELAGLDDEGTIMHLLTELVEARLVRDHLAGRLAMLERLVCQRAAGRGGGEIFVRGHHGQCEHCGEWVAQIYYGPFVAQHCLGCDVPQWGE